MYIKYANRTFARVKTGKTPEEVEEFIGYRGVTASEDGEEPRGGAPGPVIDKVKELRHE